MRTAVPISMTHPTNYCRSIVRQLMQAVAAPHTNAAEKEACRRVVASLTRAVKFVLPDIADGYHDPELKALDMSKPLRLPYPAIALEFFDSRSDDGVGVPCRKEVVFAEERLVGDEVEIRMAVIAQAEGSSVWSIFPMVRLPSSGYAQLEQVAPGKQDYVFTLHDVPTHVDQDDYSRGISQFFGFLNTLACSNVRAEKLPTPKLRKALKRRGDCLPFDEYHVLTVDTAHARQRGEAHGGSHRSPREHLRRGHIRRYESGKSIWINATIVAAGAAARISKHYEVRA